MPKGVYVKTSEHKAKISFALKGRVYSKRTKKMSDAHRQMYGELTHKFGRKGKDCNFWKGGVADKDSHGYFTYKYKKWRRTIFIRDEFTCQKCNKTHIYITAHHIKSWAKFPELRYVVGNGKTLCEDCHKGTDNYKGRGRK